MAATACGTSVEATMVKIQEAAPLQVPHAVAAVAERPDDLRVHALLNKVQRVQEAVSVLETNLHALLIVD